MGAYIACGDATYALSAAHILHGAATAARSANGVGLRIVAPTGVNSSAEFGTVSRTGMVGFVSRCVIVELLRLSARRTFSR